MDFHDELASIFDDPISTPGFGDVAARSGRLRRQRIRRIRAAGITVVAAVVVAVTLSTIDSRSASETANEAPELSSTIGSADLPPRERLMIGPEVGDIGYLDPAAFGYQGESGLVGPSGDGPFDVFDRPEGGEVILWYFHSVGLRPVGHVVTPEELARAPRPTATTATDGGDADR